MLERFQTLSTFWRVTIFLLGALILILGIIFATNQTDANEEDDGNGLGIIDPIPTTPTDPTPTEEPPTETPTEEPEPIPTHDYPINEYGKLTIVPPEGDPGVSVEEFDQINLIVINGVTNLYRIVSGETDEERRIRLQQWIDLDSPLMVDVVEWNQLGGLGFETGGTIGSVSYIGIGDNRDIRFNIHLTIASVNPSANANGNISITKESGMYQVALRQVDGVWKIWAVEEI